MSFRIIYHHMGEAQSSKKLDKVYMLVGFVFLQINKMLKFQNRKDVRRKGEVCKEDLKPKIP